MAPTIPIDYTGQRAKIGLGDMTGKTRKVSKGHSTFVPDYRHAVETVAESDVLGSSGRVDMDFAASEDSFGLKRKRHGGMEVGRSDQFGVPSQVLSLSKMSPAERRDLEMRLTKELEQVRMFQSRIASFHSDAIAGLPASGGYSYQSGSQRGAVSGGFPRTTNSASTMASGKKKGATGKNGSRTKGAALVPRTEPMVRDLPHTINFAPVITQCKTLLTLMMKHQHGWVFNEPVDTEKHKIPDYFNIIKHPMDLGTIKTRLLSGQYSHPIGFAEDVRLTFRNAMTYNPVGHDVHTMAGILSKFFETRWKQIAKKIPATAVEPVEPAASKSRVTVEAESTYVAPPAKKQKSTPPENRSKPQTDQKVMSDAEKNKLREELEAYMEELPENIIEFLKGSNGNQTEEDEIEIDFEACGNSTLITLRKLMDDFMLEKQRNQAKVGQCEIEMGSVSGFSNLSAQPPKGNEPADEDVDIDGDDPPPISSSSPVEIEKDVTRRNSSSSSSGSSSDSGSSSSETDSGNSLAGELVDGANSTAPPGKVNETECQVEQKEINRSPAARDPSDGHSEQSPSNSSLIEPNSRQEGENAPADRQVSPDKNHNYRAALLKSRFADIIIKAQENTNEKGERTNTEKLKLEREEVERRRREEKARLQAEAKAAEEARKKAEQEAAAEAKKKLELEREAARLALQQMERTVEINESSQFMEDLELFRAAPEEHLQSLVEDASPENSRDCLGSFKFEGNTNPLEQLGLYMKNDEDEDEEVELQSSIPGTSNDPEEGEID